MHRLLALLILSFALLPPAHGTPDGMKARTAACVACHGAEGRATGAGYFPRIAGKPQGYLYDQLINFRDGRRVNASMNHLVANLSDAYLAEMARYFAAQHPPHATPTVAAVPASTLARGRQLALQGAPARKIPACVACHGQGLMGVEPAIPGLLGLPRDYLNLQLGAWRSGVRKAAAPDCMSHVARSLTADEVVAVTAWLSGQPPLGTPEPATAPLPLPCGGVQ